MPQPKRILISGYYGLRNTGDEAVLAAIVKGLRAQMSDVEITVLSASPEETAAAYGIRALPRMSASAVRAAIRETDLLISGGGSLLQDATSFKSLAYYLLVISEARRNRRKVMVLGQGIGPLRRGISRRLTGRALDGIEMIAVRDPQSADLLRRIGVRGPVEVTADPTLILNPCPADQADGLLREAGLEPDEDIIAVSLRRWPEAPELEAMVAAELSELAQRIPARFLLIAMQSPNDRDMADRMAESIGQADRFVVQPREWAPEQMLGVLGRCRFVLGMRLHALILSATAGVPSLGIVYDPKVEQFVQMTRQPGISLRETADGRLVETALSAWNNREALASHLVEAIPEMKEAAMRNFVLAAELLKRDP